MEKVTKIALEDRRRGQADLEVTGNNGRNQPEVAAYVR